MSVCQESASRVKSAMRAFFVSKVPRKFLACAMHEGLLYQVCQESASLVKSVLTAMSAANNVKRAMCANSAKRVADSAITVCGTNGFKRASRAVTCKY